MNLHKFAEGFSQHYDVLETTIENAEAMGYSFIELRYNAPHSFIKKISGLDQLAIGVSRQAGSRSARENTANIIADGWLFFYPDKQNRPYGYLLDTPKNRKWLAVQLSKPKIIITDKTVKNEIISLAIKLGLPTELIKSVDKTINFSLKGDALKEAEGMSEIDTLKAELAKVQAEKAELEAFKADVKPLTQIAKARTAARTTTAKRTIKKG